MFKMTGNSKSDKLRGILDALRDRPFQGELKDRHEGRLATLESDTGDASLDRRQFGTGLLALVFSSSGAATAFVSDALNVDSLWNGDTSLNEGDWSVSPRFADLILRGTYNFGSQHDASGLTNGDRAVIQSCQMHWAQDLESLRQNVPLLEEALKQTSDPNARVAVGTRLLVDLNLLNDGERMTKALRARFIMAEEGLAAG